MTVTALLDLQLKPEAVAGAKDVVDGVLVATRAFPGCLGVDVLVDAEDDAHLLLIEHWESMEHDAAYRAWRATPDGANDLGAIAEAVTLSRFTAA